MTRWVRRVALTAAVATGVVAGATLLKFEPEPVRVVLLTVLALAGAWAVAAAQSRDAVIWYAAPTHPPVTRGRDRTTQTHLRHLEDHQASRHPDPVVRDTIAALADRMLQLRHDVRLHSERGRELLGPTVCQVVDGPVVRLSPRHIDTCLRTIEEL